MCLAKIQITLSEFMTAVIGTDLASIYQSAEMALQKYQYLRFTECFVYFYLYHSISCILFYSSII